MCLDRILFPEYSVSKAHGTSFSCRAPVPFAAMGYAKDDRYRNSSRNCNSPPKLPLLS